MNRKDREMEGYPGLSRGPQCNAFSLGMLTHSQVWSERDVSLEKVRAMRQDTGLAGHGFADRGRGVSQAKLERTPHVQSVKDLESQS